jgi:hypothetical protein
LAVDREGTARQQTAKPVYFSYQPVAYGGAAYGSATQVTSGQADPPVGTVYLAIPGSGTATQASGHYDGVNWTLTLGSRLCIDYQADGGFTQGVIAGAPALPAIAVGDARRKSEIVPVQQIIPDAANNRVIVAVTISRQHARGATIVLLQPHPTNSPPINSLDGFPGNPGPQPNFNFMAENYRAVIPHVEQIE